MNLLSNVWSFVTTKYRLVIEYVLIGLLITTAGFTLSLWLGKVKIERKLASAKIELTVLKSNITTLKSVADTQQKSIDDLLILRTTDSKIIVGLIGDFATIAKKTNDVAEQFDALEKLNDEVAQYFNSSIPPVLVACLRHEASCGNSEGNKDSKSNSP